MANRTFELEKDRLINEGADPKLFDYFIVEKLLTELIRNPRYGKKVNGDSEAELIRVKEDGTFNIETPHINGHAMTRYENGDIELYKVEVTAHENRVGEEAQVKYKKRNIDRIVFDKNGVIIEQSTFSTFKHGFL